MSTRIICDCGCSRELTGPDAGQVPIIIRSPEGIELEVNVKERDGAPLNMRARCVRELVAKGELVEAPAEGTVPIRKRRAS